MKNTLFCLMALAAPLCAQNLFDNGTMDTAGGWKGDGKMVKDEPSKGETEKETEKGTDKQPPNRFLLLSAKKNGPVAFRQEIDTKGLISVVVKFRYKTKDYKGPGIEIRGKRMDGGSTYTNRNLEVDGEWHDMSWNFTQVGGSKKIDFSIILIQGEGEVAFDDVTAEAAK
jgi:hypothetical protein